MTELAGAVRTLGLILSGRADLVSWDALSEEDFRRLQVTAERERVAPLVYHLLERAGWPKAAACLTGPLRASFYNAGALNLMLYEELDRVLGVLPAGSAVLLKGAALAASLYPNLALRPMCDLDLLVPADGLERAVQAVVELGYRRLVPEMAPGLDRQARYHVALSGGPQGQVSVELHWRLVAGEADWRSPPVEWFWRQTESWTMQQPDGRILSALQLRPTAHLLYLAAHLAFQHGGGSSRLGWLYDLHLILARRGDQLDWNALLEKAREFRWSAALGSALSRARDVLATPLPPDLLEKLAAGRDVESERAVAAGRSTGASRGARVYEELRALDWRGRARLALAILWPSPDYLRWRHRLRPAWLWPLGYPYRWGVIAFQLLGALLPKLLRRS